MKDNFLAVKNHRRSTTAGPATRRWSSTEYGLACSLNYHQALKEFKASVVCLIVFIYQSRIAGRELGGVKVTLVTYSASHNSFLLA